MASLEQSDERRFTYRAVTREGRRVRDVVRAADETTALRELMAGGLTVTDLSEAGEIEVRSADRDLKPTERVLVMRQLALMLEAGVTLLEALETVAAGVAARKGRAQLMEVIAALKRGEALGVALRTHMPGFPYYVYAMAEVGEAAGHVPEVLRVASEQMAYEDRLRRDLVGALTYPALLACAGVLAVAFIFVEIVPRFSALIGQNAARMPLMSKIVFAIGHFVNAHLILTGGGLAALVAAMAFAASQPAVRERLYNIGRALPVIGDLLNAREIATWARLTSFALGNGVALMEASALARQGAPAGPFRDGLAASEAELRSGIALHVALGRHTRLTAMDLSLLRTGQKSGALASMFGFLADSYDDRLKDAMKRFTALAEPAAIAAISVVVGVIALSLVMALASIYDSVQ
ncbi:MAG TPA: type II secretion system F family protein [Caulobacteraceae bacterium]|nr:type II secretion system F family protein [Caulobacteraceae bacterium]